MEGSDSVTVRQRGSAVACSVATPEATKCHPYRSEDATTALLRYCPTALFSALLLCCAVATLLFFSFGCGESEGENQKPEKKETEKIAILYEGEFGGEWCIDELKLIVDGDTVVKEWFESEDFPPKDWSVSGLNIPPQSWFKGSEDVYITSMHEGKYCAQIWSGYSQQQEYLILPEFKKGFISDAKDVKLSFFVVGNVSLCDYACVKVTVLLPGRERWAEAYKLDDARLGLKDYEWKKVEFDLTNPEQFYEQQTEE